MSSSALLFRSNEDYEAVNTFVVAKQKNRKKRRLETSSLFDGEEEYNNNDGDGIVNFFEKKKTFKEDVSLGKKISDYRAQNNLSQKEFAQFLQINVLFVTELERNEGYVHEDDIHFRNAVQKMNNFFLTK